MLKIQNSTEQYRKSTDKVDLPKIGNKIDETLIIDNIITLVSSVRVCVCRHVPWQLGFFWGLKIQRWFIAAVQL